MNILGKRTVLLNSLATEANYFDFLWLPEDILVFRGDGNEAAEEFIRAVNIQAFKTNKIDDQSWITGFASTAFAGNALRWYRTLPITTRQDWDLLQESILSFDWQRNARPELGYVRNSLMGP